MCRRWREHHDRQETAQQDRCQLAHDSTPFVIKAPGVDDDDALARAVIETCRGCLADFKVPRAVYFVDEFPLGTLDKILKNKLREMADAYPAV